MNTYEEQAAFFNSQCDGIKQAAAEGGAKAVVTLIESFDDIERRILYVFARTALVHQEWEGRDLDTYVDVCHAGIQELLRQGDEAEDDETARRRTDTANVMSYNMAADLADCWPGDAELERTTRHFEAGLQAADNCVRWREELDKPPGPRSMAWWAKGMHEMSLGKARKSLASFQTSLQYAEAAATDPGDFGVILGKGYVGLAQLAAGDGNGRTVYESAIAQFDDQLSDDTRKDDAQFGIDQLQTVHRRYVE